MARVRSVLTKSPTANPQVGKFLRILATYPNSGGDNGLVRATTAAAVTNVNDIGVGVLSGATIGSQSSVTITDDDGTDFGTISYKWQTCGAATGGSCNDILTGGTDDVTTATYTPELAHTNVSLGRFLQVLFSYPGVNTGAQTTPIASNRREITTAYLGGGYPWWQCHYYRSECRRDLARWRFHARAYYFHSDLSMATL